MTDQVPIVARRLSQDTYPADAIAPPVAPLVMPKQVLVHDRPLLARLIGVLLAPLSTLKPGFRRIG